MRTDSTKYFYCYSKRLSDFLSFEKGIPYMIKALHPESKDMFTLYEKGLELRMALDEYKKLNNSNFTK